MNPNKLSIVLSATALVVAVGATGGPVIAAAIAPNSHKVDGLHAVKSTASVKARKGKLVATNKKTGRLPDNIIAKAPDAAKLNGFTHAQMRALPLMGGSADLANGAALTGGGGVELPDASQPSLTWVFMLPPDYTAGSTVSIDFYVGRGAGAACSAVFEAAAGAAPVNNDQVLVPVTPATGPVNFIATAGNIFLVKRTVTFGTAAMKPGGYAAVAINRAPADPLDNCAGEVLFAAGQARY